MKFYRDNSAPVQPDQLEKEFTDLLGIYRAMNPVMTLEIGLRAGGTFYQWMKHARNGASIIGIELPRGKWGTRTMQDYTYLWEFASYRGLVISVILGNSQHPYTNAMLSQFLFDFIFIDGDHSYEGVKRDFELSWKRLDSGGLIAIHDILPDNSDTTIQVFRYWQELKDNYQWKELLSEPGQSGRGIGLIYK